MKQQLLKTALFIVCLCLGLNLFAQNNKVDPEFRYTEDWESIRSHYKVPDWFRDAKFGIFVNWGPYFVPAFSSEKYSKGIYQESWTRGGMNPYAYHRLMYGDPSEFGYKDLVPLFKAEKLDASQWLKLFKKAEARYVAHVADYHDGFAMYASKHTRWNVADMGPKKDIMQLVSDACKTEGLKFGVSSHYALNHVFYNKNNPKWDTSDPEFADLYGGPTPKDRLPTQQFLDKWWNRTTDVIDQYEPDLLWFDFGLDKPGFKSVHKKILSYYYNKGLDWNKEVIFNDKNMKGASFPEDLIVLDIERGRMDSTFKYPWQTDTSVGVISWGYIKHGKYKSYNYLMDELVDIVRKNGCLLLNIGSKADGTIPEESEEILTKMGEWFSVNSEAIFDTRPWTIFGEGSTQISRGNHTEAQNAASSSEDIRFTLKGDMLYATSLDWATDGQFTIHSLAKNNPYESRKIKSVDFLSGKNTSSWKQTDKGLEVIVDGEKPCEAAISSRIQFK